MRASHIILAVITMVPTLCFPQGTNKFYFGADLSYVNQITDFNGVYKDNGQETSPYRIFKDHGANIIRFRLWNNPVWTKEVYGNDGKQLYNDLKDVEKGIKLSKEQGLEVLLDFHYSDTWADPGKQEIPKAWKDIRSIDVLADSVYRFTFNTLSYLDKKGLMPELVQVGNEINCGMLYTNAPEGFPPCNACDGNWKNLGAVLNQAIRAVRDVSSRSLIKSRILLHVADPKNVEWWFDNVTAQGKVVDFDMIGFSYYPIWHTTVPLAALSSKVAAFRLKYNKPIMILETAYPWTTDNHDAYTNIFGSQPALSGFPFTVKGQLEMMKAITQSMKEGGGSGVVYWESAWITSALKDLWGQGSAWENCTLFDFEGNVMESMDFMKYKYKN
ncbi:MAG TPA: glycosyl hydrolase 53 family protein [Chryseolinea sp.]